MDTSIWEAIRPLASRLPARPEPMIMTLNSSPMVGWLVMWEDTYLSVG